MQASSEQIRRIFKLYENCLSQPIIEATPNAFKIVIPNMNESLTEFAVKPITAQMRKVIDYIAENGQITDKELEKLLKIKKTRAFNLVKEMKGLGLIYVEGRGKEKKLLLKQSNRSV